MKIAYNPDRRFSAESMRIIEHADAICRSYAAQGYSLTLRQTFYQFVARGLLPNTEQSYDKLGRLVSEARLAGLIDWDHIVDRTRKSDAVPHWDSPQEIVDAVADQYRINKWADQPCYVEAWVEKEALVDVIARPARRWDLRWFACRGYISQSAQHEAAMRLVEAVNNGQRAVILHLGDHDPSGIDMTRDIYDRINAVVRYHTDQEVEVDRLALNMNQVRRYNPPPNPAKMTDSRVGSYLAAYGNQSWELDALDPPTIDTLITEAVENLLDRDLWDASVAEEDEARALLRAVARQWDEITEPIKDGMD